MDLTGNPAVHRVSLDRGDGRNTIDDALVGELGAALDRAEADPRCRIVLLTSAPGVFSTGMNLAAAGAEAGGAPESGGAREADGAREAGGAFFDLLDRFTRTPRIVVSVVDGTVAGGGVGLVAASDLVYASQASTFALPEALWGLLPCCVLPFLARRVGFQRAYAMTLTTQPLDAPAALACGLADEVRADPLAAVRPLAFRAGKLDAVTIGDLKRYAARLWPIDGDTRRLAVGELGRLMALPAVRERLATFATSGRFPWEA